MNKLSDVSSIVKQFQEHTQTNEIPNFDFQLVRFGPKKAYWYYSYSYDSWNEIILGSWNGDFEEKRFNTSNKPDQDISEIRAKVKNLIDEQNRIHREKAALHARKLIPTLSTGHHEYLEKKRVKSYGTFIDSSFLIIPVRNNNELVGLQRISKNGEKTFYEGTIMSASYHALSPFKDASIIHLSEGYATAATIQEAFPEVPSVMAFNANNLPKVAKYIREVNPSCEIVIFADKDSINKLGYRTGEHYAQIACAQVTNCRYVLPDCGIIEKCDFNDVGVEATRKQLNYNQIILVDTNEPQIIDEKFDYPRFQGIAQQFFKYYYESSRIKRTRFAMASTISTLSTMWGNKVSFNGLATNMYCLIAGSSTSGKEDPVALADLVFTMAGQEKMVSKNLSSDSAILTELSPIVDKNKPIVKTQFPTQLHIFKEASSLFYLANDNKTPYAANMANIYQDLFTSPFKPYSGKNLKNERLGECFSPSVSILGSMTDTDFEACLRPELFDKGLGGRFLFFYDKEFKAINRELQSKRVPQVLAQYINAARARDPLELKIEKNLSDVMFDLFDEYREEAHYSDGPISKAKGRLPEHFSKMLMLSAMSQEREEITRDDFDWTKAWFETYIKELDILFSQKMHLSKMSKINTEVELAIKATGTKGIFHSKLLRSSVSQKNSLDSKKLNDIINFLKETEAIVASKKKNGDSERESIIYFHKSFVKKIK